MKKLSIINKLIYFVNYIFAVILLFGYVLPYVSPRIAPSFSVISLTIPVLITINIAFVMYWLIGLKRQATLSLFCLLIGYFVSSPLYIFKSNKKQANNTFSVMNYNVRMFNTFNWIEEDNIAQKINDFIKTKNPDILCIQEFHSSSIIKYPYQFIKNVRAGKDFGQAIFSKYKIINSGALSFKHTANNAIYIDILKNQDTIRIYNLHLESLGLNVNKENFGQKTSEKLVKRLGKEFIKQQTQVDQVINHKKNCKYPVIISGDFNNTAYSWTYNQFIHQMNDSFIESGKGFGKTFEIKKIPLRIDFIFADKAFIFTEHKNYPINYSDHKPIMAKIGI